MIYVCAGLTVVLLIGSGAIYALSSRCKIARDEFAITTKGSQRRVVFGSKSIFVFRPFQSVIRARTCDHEMLLAVELEDTKGSESQPTKIEISGVVTAGTEPDVAVQYVVSFGALNAEARAGRLVELQKRLVLAVHRWAADCGSFDTVVEKEIPSELNARLHVTASKFGLAWRTTSFIFAPADVVLPEEDERKSHRDILSEVLADHRMRQQLQAAENKGEMQRLAELHDDQKATILKTAESESIASEIRELSKEVENDAVRFKAEMKEDVPEESQIRDEYANRHAERESVQVEREKQLRQSLLDSDTMDG